MSRSGFRRRLDENRIVGVGLDMLFQILRTLESLSTGRALVRLEWNMHSNMRSDMIPLHSSRLTGAPAAGQVQVVGAFATDMLLTDVVLYVYRQSSISTLLEMAEVVSASRLYRERQATGEKWPRHLEIISRMPSGRGKVALTPRHRIEDAKRPCKKP